MTPAPAVPTSIVPIPPSTLVCNIHTLPAGTVVHRIHDTRFSAGQFNPGVGNSRFAPITAAGRSRNRQRSTRRRHTNVRLSRLPSTTSTRVRCSSRYLGRPSRNCLTQRSKFTRIRLARFFSADLMKWNCSRSQLIDTPPSTYPQTRQWSKAVHEFRQFHRRNDLDVT